MPRHAVVSTQAHPAGACEPRGVRSPATGASGGLIARHSGDSVTTRASGARHAAPRAQPGGGDGAPLSDTAAKASAPSGDGRSATAAPARPAGPEIAVSAGTPVAPRPETGPSGTARLLPDTGAPGARPADTAAAPGASQAAGVAGGGAAPLPGATGGIDTEAPGWASRVVQEVRLAREGGAQEHELVLRPERLGRVQIRFELNEGNVTVRILTETPEAARLFAEAQPRLADAFGRAGLDLAQHHSESAPQTGGERQTGQGGQGRQGAPGPEADGREPDAEGAAADPESARQPAPAAPRRGGIDLTA
jgi:flagellar hook-length control protein FliK